MKFAGFVLRGFSRPKEALIASLGKLENEVINEVWSRGEVSVREIADGLGDRFAYTTIMTTLDRLYKKGLLKRRRLGKAYLYQAKFSPEELERGVTEDVIGSLLDAGTEHIEPVLACIVDAVSERDLQLLDELERLVREKRLELQKEK